MSGHLGPFVAGRPRPFRIWSLFFILILMAAWLLGGLFIVLPLFK